MKKLLIIACFTAGSLCMQAQTRGTNTIGLGLKFESSENEGVQTLTESNSYMISLGYGYFIEDKHRIGIDVFYEKAEGSSTSASFNSENDSEGYGGNLNYQRYFSLFKNFYAFAGGRGEYKYTRTTQTNLVTPVNEYSTINNSYSLGPYGGLSWFLSKRIALEAELISAFITYKDGKSTGPIAQVKTTSTDFDLSTTGTVTGLPFRIYFLF